MDTKKVIAKLVKIAQSQQKIINKLAQVPLAEAPLTQHLDPAQTQHSPAKAVLDALPPAVRAVIVNLEERGNDMMVGFKPGQKTQRNYDAILSAMQKLTDQGVLAHAYNLKAV